MARKIRVCYHWLFGGESMGYLVIAELAGLIISIMCAAFTAWWIHRDDETWQSASAILIFARVATIESRSNADEPFHWATVIFFNVLVLTLIIWLFV